MSVVLFTLATTLLTACYANQGQTTKSDVDGFETYTNRTLKVGTLTPSAWQRTVGINGMYTLTAPAKGDDRAQIYLNSRPIEELLSQVGGTSHSTLEDYKVYFLSHEMKEDIIGPDLKYQINKTTLAGRDAWETHYSYTGTDDLKWFVREVFTVANGRVYFLSLYSLKTDDPNQQQVFETMKNSLRTL